MDSTINSVTSYIQSLLLNLALHVYKIENVVADYTHRW